MLQHASGWRYGQALFNKLLDVRPDIAARLRGSLSDPFYAEQKSDLRVTRAFEVISHHWHTSPSSESGTKADPMVLDS